MPAPFLKYRVKTVYCCSILGFNLYRNMSIKYTGEVKVLQNELNLDSTLLGGQSFRWEKCEQESKGSEWRGVAHGFYWIIKQSPSSLKYEVFTPLKDDFAYESHFFDNILKRYFRLNVDLSGIMEQWQKAHTHFQEISLQCQAVRVLSQEPFENIICFICSQNNNIKRISTMIRWFCSNFGKKIGTFNGREEFTFPSLEALSSHDELEKDLRLAKFGYRAKFIAECINKIHSEGGEEYFKNLQLLSFNEARNALVKLPGIGFKVADCICLMSLNHLEAVPIDTHILQIACQYYLPNLPKTKSITRKNYEEVANYFRKVYGPYAGWAQTVLFCSDLPQFQRIAIIKNSKSKIKKIK